MTGDDCNDIVDRPPSGRVRRGEDWRAEWWHPNLLTGVWGLSSGVSLILSPVRTPLQGPVQLLRSPFERWRVETSWDEQKLQIGEHCWAWKDIQELELVGDRTFRIVAQNEVVEVKAPRRDDRRRTLLAHWTSHLVGAEVTLPTERIEWSDQVESSRTEALLSREERPAWLATGNAGLMLWLMSFGLFLLGVGWGGPSIPPAAFNALWMVQLLSLPAILLAYGWSTFRWSRRGTIDAGQHRLEIREPSGEVWSMPWDAITDIRFDDVSITLTTSDEEVVWHADRERPVRVRSLGRDLRQRWWRAGRGRQDEQASAAERHRLGTLRTTRQ